MNGKFSKVWPLPHTSGPIVWRIGVILLRGSEVDVMAQTGVPAGYRPELWALVTPLREAMSARRFVQKQLEVPPVARTATVWGLPAG